MVPPAVMKRIKTSHRSNSDFQSYKKINYVLDLEDIHASSAQLPLFGDMESMDTSEPLTPVSIVAANTTADNMDLETASDPRTPDPTVTENTATLSEQLPSFEEMDSKDTSDPTESNLTATSVVSSTIENMESKGDADPMASESNVPHSTAMDSSSSDPTPSEKGPILQKGESKNSPKSDALESDMPEITDGSDQLPSLEDMESKSASDPNASKPNVPFSTVTEPFGSTVTTNIASNMESKGASTSTAPESNVTREDAITPSEQVPILDQVQFESPPIPNSMETGTFRVTKETIERRRRVRQMKDRQREYRIVAHDLAAELSDQQLHEILQISPNQRNTYGEITTMDFVFRFVPRNHNGLPIDDNSAMGILQSAVKKAVCARLDHIKSIVSFDSDVTEDGYSRITAYWHGEEAEEPALPDSLADLSAFIVFKKKSYHPLPASISFEGEEYDPEDIHPDDGSRGIPESTMTKDPPSQTLENLESKSVSEPNVAVSPEGLPLLEDMGAKNASEPTMTEVIDAPSERLHDRIEFETPQNPYVTKSNSSASNMAEPKASDSAVPSVGKFLETQLRRPERGRERNHLHRVLSGKVGRKLTDKQLREILQKSPSERDYIGRITNMDYVSQFVSREHDGFFIDNDLAANILQTGTEKAVYRRFKHTGQIKAWYSRVNEDGYFSITARWYGQEPKIPDCLKDLPTIIRLEKFESDPANFRRNIGHDDYGGKVTPAPPSYLPGQAPTTFGSVGFIGLLDNDSCQHHVLATVGHVMNDTDQDWVSIRTDPNGLFELSETVLPSTAELMPSFKRGYYDQPSYRQGLPAREIMDEICLIDANSLPEHQIRFLHHSDPIDCNALYPFPKEKPIVAAESPAYLDENVYVGSIQHWTPLQVFKHGAKTGFTEGTLIHVELADGKSLGEKATTDERSLGENDPTDGKSLGEKATTDEGSLEENNTMDEGFLEEKDAMDEGSLEEKATTDEESLEESDITDEESLEESDTTDEEFLEEKDAMDERSLEENDATDEGSLEEDDSTDEELVAGYYLHIEWMSPGEPFADYGDSGSLVFAKFNGKIVPLGLHQGSIEGESWAWLLWSWGNEIQESLNSDLIFCTRAKCEYAAQ